MRGSRGPPQSASARLHRSQLYVVHHIIESVFRLAARTEGCRVHSRDCAGKLKTCWTKPPGATLPLWKLDAVSLRMVLSVRPRDVPDAAFMAKNAVANMSSRRERLAKPTPGRLDVCGVTIGCLLPALADGKDDDCWLEKPDRHDVSGAIGSCDATGASTSMHTICP